MIIRPLKNAINEKTKLVTIQRSKGYLPRPTFSVQQIGELISFVKKIKPDVICMVDNCYGEFVETIEPSDVGDGYVCRLSDQKFQAVALRQVAAILSDAKIVWKELRTD